MKAYLDLLREVLDTGTPNLDRTGTGTLNVFGRQIRFDLAQGFPAVTTKRLFFKGVAAELGWFLDGSTNVSGLHKHGVHIWDAWADAEGELGPVYGHQWRRWRDSEGREIDQIAQALHTLRTDPSSRRVVVSAWNVGELPEMKLEPCHALFQFYVLNGRLSCSLYQRSADLFLGVPFNIASYALLTHLMARSLGLEVGEFVHTMGVAHIYLNHVEQVREQLGRDPLPLPRLELEGVGVGHDLRGLVPEQMRLAGYQSHGTIKAPIAV